MTPHVPALPFHAAGSGRRWHRVLARYGVTQPIVEVGTVSTELVVAGWAVVGTAPETEGPTATIALDKATAQALREHAPGAPAEGAAGRPAGSGRRPGSGRTPAS